MTEAGGEVVVMIARAPYSRPPQLGRELGIPLAKPLDDSIDFQGKLMADLEGVEILVGLHALQSEAGWESKAPHYGAGMTGTTHC